MNRDSRMDFNRFGVSITLIDCDPLLLSFCALSHNEGVQERECSARAGLPLEPPWARLSVRPRRARATWESGYCTAALLDRRQSRCLVEFGWIAIVVRECEIEKTRLIEAMLRPLLELKPVGLCTASRWPRVIEVWKSQLSNFDQGSSRFDD